MRIGSRHTQNKSENKSERIAKVACKKLRKKERGRANRKHATDNKRLANPSCQFNLVSNPGEMLIRTTALSAALSSNRSHLAMHARYATTLYFRAKIPPLAGPDYVEIVCKASCASPRSYYPFRPSTLVIYRGYVARTTRAAESVLRVIKRRKTAVSRGLAILSFRLDHPASTFTTFA